MTAAARAAIAVGVALGAVYALSPATVLTALAAVPVFRRAVKDLSPLERRRVTAVLALAVGLRVLAVLGLFLVTDHTATAFRTFFGDEEYFLRRSIWLRNIALGLPLHSADFIYAFDPMSRTSYVYVLALVQILIGPAPYGAHLISILCFVTASLVVYRLVRPSFGSGPSLAGLCILLFTPSLFAWSVSVLKESLYWLVSCVGMVGAVTAARAATWRRAVAGLGVVALTAVVAQTLRDGGLLMAGMAGAAGSAAGFAALRPRVAIAGAMTVALAAVVALTRGPVQDRIVTETRRAATVHFDTVNTPGSVYTILDDGFYQDKGRIQRMTLREGVRFVAGALAQYVTAPLPWQIRSRVGLAYLPEQLLWYALVLLAPFGVVRAWRRDKPLTIVLMAYTLAAAGIVALTSGNVGTLVRHRGLAVPSLVWFGVLGARRLRDARRLSPQEVHADRR